MTVETTISPTLASTKNTKGEARTNGLNEEQIKAMLALPERFADDPGFVERLAEGAREARQQINAEYLRKTDKEESK